MCRFIIYFGIKQKFLYEVIYLGSNNMINQSYTVPFLPGLDLESSGKNYNSKLNIDGFGVAWKNYFDDKKLILYKNSLPIHQDHNLKDLSKTIKSNLFIFHLRANLLKCVSPLTYLNCHPFIYKDISFVHNGCIFNFIKIKHMLYDGINNNLKPLILGNTDSEIIFYLFLTYYKQTNDEVKSLLYLINFINQLKFENKNIEILLNLGITLGYYPNEKCIFLRYSNSNSITPLSLYYNKKENIICSEPINNDESYNIFPTNKILVLNKNYDHRPKITWKWISIK